jgi:hypothetical protein
MYIAHTYLNFDLHLVLDFGRLSQILKKFPNSNNFDEFLTKKNQRQWCSNKEISVISPYVKYVFHKILNS